MAQAAVPVWVWWASLAVSTAATVYSQKQQASAVKAANEQKKTSAELETNSREIQRRKRLLTALASQNSTANVKNFYGVNDCGRRNGCLLDRRNTFRRAAGVRKS